MNISPSSVRHKKILFHLVYDFKHYGRHKTRLVADGHLTDIISESVYFGVFYLHFIWILVFISEPTKMKMRNTYIGNVYLELKSLKKVNIIIGTEFGDRALLT